jgi:hypothetical protein
MPLWRVLRHRLRAFRRVPFFERRALSVILGGFIALYLGGGLVLFGLFFDDLVRNVAPGRDPLLVASRGLLPLGLLYAAVRVFVESGLGVDVRPYLALPLRRSVLVGVGAVLALFSLWNAVPLAFIVTVGVEAAVDGALGPALRFGLVSVGVLAVVTYAVPMLRRLVSRRPLFAAAGVLLVVGSVGLEAVDATGGASSLLDLSGWMLGGTVDGRVGPTVATILVLGGMGGGYVRWLRTEMDLDRATRTTSSPGQASDRLGPLTAYGPAVREAVLELRLVLRNSKPRLSLFSTLLIAGAVAFLGYFVGSWAELRELLSGTQMLNTALWQGLFGTGAFVIFHGANGFSWEGGHFEATMAHPVSTQNRIDGKLLLLGASVVLCFLVPLPVFTATGSSVWALHAAFGLYNLGVLVPAAVAGATFNRKALTLNDSMMFEANASAGRIAIALPVTFLPIGLLGLLPDVGEALMLIGGLGGVSLLAFPLWRRGLTALYRRNQHAMARGFRASRE